MASSTSEPPVLSVRNADGQLLAQCDARCYNATSPRCVCLCHGLAHGRGLQHAAMVALSTTAINHDALRTDRSHDGARLIRPNGLRRLAHPTFDFTAPLDPNKDTLIP